MPREEHILGSSSYSGGAGGGAAAAGGGGSGCSSNSRSKKIKQKKVPQRGLGVAQLEKIRLEEQQKKQSVQAVQAANILAKNAICSSTNSNNNNINNNINNNNNNSPPFLAAQCSNFRPPFHNSAPLPPPPPPQPPSSPSRTNLPSPKAFYNRHENSVRVSKNEKQGFVDRRGFSFEPQVNLPYDPSVLPPPINSRSHQIHRNCSSSSSMVNLNSSSVELNSPMEPPSNQSFRSNNYVPPWTDDDKIIGMKRSYPFSLESPPLSQCNINPKNYSKSDELLASSSDNRYTANIEPRSKCIMREGPLYSNSLPDRNVKDVNRKNERLNGDFLTLAPPNLNSKHGLFEYESIQIEEYSRSSDSFSFFPIKLPNDETTRHLSIGSNNGEKGETIDLNLKL